MATLSVLLVAATLAGQGSGARVVEAYDKLEDVTTLAAHLGSVLQAADADVRLLVYQNYKGKGRSRPSEGVQIGFFSYTKGGRRYTDETDAILFVDESLRLRFHPHRERFRDQGSFIEAMVIPIDEETLARLVKAKGIEGRIGTDRFILDSSQRDTIREFNEVLADPARKVKDPDTGPQVVIPVASEIPYGQAVTFIDGKDLSPLVVRDPNFRLVYVPTNTPLRVLKKYVKNIAGEDHTALQVEVLEGEFKGLVGEMLRSYVILSTARKGKPAGGKTPSGLKQETAADRAKKAEAQAAAKLKLGTNLETTNPKGAAGYFREAIKLAPGSRVAKEAQDRLDELQEKSAGASEDHSK